MIKTILYTSNPDFVPVNLDQVQIFAEEDEKYYVCYANENSELYKLEKGAHVLTTKNNNIYILDVTEGNTEYEYAKKCNITGIISVDYPFGEKTSSIKDFIKFQEVNNVRITIDGNTAVQTTQGYTVITKDNQLISYPEEYTLEAPIYIISKPKDQLVVGDIIVINSQYAKVIELTKDEIITIGFNGKKNAIRATKDFLFNQEMIQVLVNPLNNVDKNNILMFLATKGKKSMLPFLLMNQKNINPLMLMLLSDKADFKDILLMQALGGNIFNNNFTPEIVE